MKRVKVLAGLAAVPACAVLALIAAPVAAAGGADAVISDLEAKGYDVRINWVSGYDTKPLPLCTVTNVNNPDRSGAPPKEGDTVYVDVSCPNHDYGDGGDDGGHFDFGVGIG